MDPIEMTTTNSSPSDRESRYGLKPPGPVRRFLEARAVLEAFLLLPSVWLWWLRRSLDWVVGGPSFRRKRRHPEDLRVGDAVDAWRVIAMHPEKQLTMLMEMKSPGAGVLEFDIDDTGNGRRTITVTAYFHPAGVWGILYWFALLPCHAFIFRGMTRAIVGRAEKATRVT